MEKQGPELSSKICRYLHVKNGQPLCLFRLAAPQPCNYPETLDCYYRSGPFESASCWHSLSSKAKKTE